MVDKAQTTRYQKVKQILDRAAGDSTADYEGHGRFWHLPLPRLLNLEIYGVRMIAPPAAATHSCCHHEADDHEAKPADRSARSGLIRGLRGQPPFDGSQYPPLPWGG